MNSNLKKVFLITLFSIFLFLFAYTQQNDINTEIINYVNTVLDKKVGRGECWDLLAYALDETHAKWSRTQDFGRVINYPEENLKAGDMMRLKQVKYSWGGGTSLHFAIIYEVIDKNHLKIADQNVGGVKKVKIRDFNLEEIVKGEVTFFRPQK